MKSPIIFDVRTKIEDDALSKSMRDLAAGLQASLHGNKSLARKIFKNIESNLAKKFGARARKRV